MKSLNIGNLFQKLRPYITPLEQRWQSLAPRERKMLAVCAIVVGLLFLYYVIIQPLSNKVTQLQQDVQTQTELLAWMQPRVQRLQAQTQKTPARQLTTSQLLQMLNTSLKRTDFANNLQEVSQTQDGGVQITLQKVPFDKLVTWLVQQQKANHVEVSRMSAQRTDSIGLANVVLAIKLEN